jgi:predicted HTH transcriptional regulator
MVNADAAQGTVVFGIAPDGESVGVEPGDLDKAQRSLSQTISSKFEPRLQCTIHDAQLEGQRFVIVRSTRNRDIPYHEFDGRAFIREGTVTRQLSLPEKQSLQRSRNRNLHPGPWKCDRCGSWVGMLMSIVVTDQGVRKSYAAAVASTGQPPNL